MADQLEYECEVCGRRQLAWNTFFPQGLKPDEVKMIGWSERVEENKRKTIWYCPFHTPGGKAKLMTVAQHGLKEIKSKKDGTDAE